MQREELEAALAEERATSQREQARLASEVKFNFYLFSCILIELLSFIYLINFNLFCSERSLRRRWPRRGPRFRESAPSGPGSVLNGPESGPHSLLR